MNLLIIFCPPGRASRRYYPETRAKHAPIPGTGSNRHDFPTGRGGRRLFAKAVPLGGDRGFESPFLHRRVYCEPNSAPMKAVSIAQHHGRATGVVVAGEI